MRAQLRSALLSLVVLLVAAAAAQNTESAENEHASYGVDEEIPTEEEPSHEGDRHRNARTHHYDAEGAEKQFEVARLSREDQLIVLEEDLAFLRRIEVEPAVARVARAASAHAHARQSANWMPSTEQRQRIYALEQELNAASHALIVAQQHELELYSKMKPLYGIVSYQFMKEQEVTIKQCLKKVNDVAFNSAWWNTALGGGRAESLTDLIVGFFLNWFLTYAVLYPFASLYYILWAAPWSIYSFSSGIGDVLTALGAWFTASIVMLLPIAALIGSGAWIAKKYGPELRAAADERRRQAAERQYFYQQQQRIVFR